MCMLVACLHSIPGYPIVVGANRDEARSRPSSPPAVDASGRVFAPTDLVAGGTWLGVNRAGLFAAITNRSRDGFDPRRPSRGALVRDALAASSVDEAVARVAHAIETAPRNGFNLLVADARGGAVLGGAERLERIELDPGVHVLTNMHALDTFDPPLPDPLNEPGRPLDARALDARARDARARDLRARDAPAGVVHIDTVLAALARLCRDHRDRDGYAICKHRGDYGTVSSTLVALGDGAPHPNRFLFAEGAPCRVAYADRSAAIEGWWSAR